MYDKDRDNMVTSLLLQQCDTVTSRRRQSCSQTFCRTRSGRTFAGWVSHRKLIPRGRNNELGSLWLYGWASMHHPELLVH